MFEANAFVLVCLKCGRQHHSQSSAVRQRCQRGRLYSSAHRRTKWLHQNCHRTHWYSKSLRHVCWQMVDMARRHLKKLKWVQSQWKLSP